MDDRRSADRGATFAEYAALIVLAALILGGLVTLSVPDRVRAGMSRKICEIFHPGTSSKSCGADTATSADPYKPTQPCTVSTSSTRYGGDIAFASVDVGGGITLIESTDSQGHVTVTAVDDTSAKAVTGAGAGYQWGKAINVGAGVSVNGGGTFRTGDSWTFDNKKQADEFTGEIQKYAYATEAEQTPIFGPAIVGFAYKHSPWAPKVRQPDVVRYSVDFAGAGNGNAGINVGQGKEHEPGSKNEQKGGKHKAGKHAAKSDSGRTGGRKKTDPNLAEGNGEVSFGQQETIENDKKHGTVSATIDVHAKADASGKVAGQSVPEGWEGDGAVKVTSDLHGNIISVDLMRTTTVNGTTTVTTSHLPVTDANRAEVVKDLGLYGASPPLPAHLLWDDLAPTDDPGDAGNDWQRLMYQQAQTTKVTYDTSTSDSPVGASVKAGLVFQLNADRTITGQKLTSAQYLGPPGPDGKRHYQRWKDCK